MLTPAMRSGGTLFRAILNEATVCAATFLLQRSRNTTESRSTGVEESCLQCTICLNILEDPLEAPCCSNCFCRKCLQQSLAVSERCPVCRKEFLHLEQCTI